MCAMDGLILGGTAGGISTDSLVSGFWIFALSECPFGGIGGHLCEDGEGMLHFNIFD